MFQSRLHALRWWWILSIFVPAAARSDCARLIIFEQNRQIHNPVTGVTFRGKQFEFSNVAPGKTIEIAVEGRKEKILLPSPMNDRLVEYLLNPPRGRFDCNCFVHWMNGLSTTCGEFNPRLWHFEPFNPETAEPGDTLNLGNAVGPGEYQPAHAAIYIDHGFYLSKLNDLGPLIVVELYEMSDGFNATEAYFMRVAK